MLYRTVALTAFLASTADAAAVNQRELGLLADAAAAWRSFSEDIQCASECASSLLANWDGEVSRECWQCLNHPAIGQLPFSATSDLLQFKLGVGYTEGWCGRSRTFCDGQACASEGVDITHYPTGWRPDGQGGYTGCEVKSHFPGANATSHMSHAYVKAEMATLPRLQYEGKVWRGNELGFIISNELFWPNANPRTVGLGAPVNQHMVMRPLLDSLLGSCDAACAARLRASAARTFGARGWSSPIAVQPDIIAWVHRELFERLFPGKSAAADLPVPAADFVALQASLVSLSTITQLLSDGLTQLIAGSTLAKLQAVYDAYRPLVQEVHGAALAGQDCAPSDCVDLATSNLLDALFFAGGLSVPSGISTGLWVLHADTSAYGETFPQGAAATPAQLLDDPMAFYFESLRFFPPVVGFPWWTTPPARAADDTASQTAGGVRKILNLALANKDPNAWGGDAHQFRVRDLHAYGQNFVGFADYARDDSVANGAMNRHCPAKELALQMGKAFFEAWEPEQWCTRDSPSYTEATPFVDAFTLFKGKASGQGCAPQWFGASECCRGSCSWEWSGWFAGAFKCKA